LEIYDNMLKNNIYFFSNEEFQIFFYKQDIVFLFFSYIKIIIKNIYKNY